MPDVHPAAEAFGAVADTYERGRPGYPAGAVEAIVDGFDLGEASVVVEVGAGTGKFTAMLAPRVGAVIAVEPSRGMRRRLRVMPGVEVRPGVAESLPVDDRCADAVVAAQAWHWVDGTRGIPEASRVLRGGGLALVWNVRDETARINAEITRLVEPYLRDAPTHRWQAWRQALDASEMFLDLTTEVFANTQVLEVPRLRPPRSGAFGFVHRVTAR